MDEKEIEKLIQDCLAEMNFLGCNFPMVERGITLGGDVEVMERIQSWTIRFTCSNPTDKSKMQKVKFEIETPSDKTKDSVKAEILQNLRGVLKAW